MKEKIKLHSRYGVKTYLELLSEEDCTYKLVTKGQYIRAGYLNIKEALDGEYCFIDPEGGPFLKLENKIEDTNYIIKSMYSSKEGFILKVKEDKNA